MFNLHDVGLGNNGGSRTLVRCAETIAGLGHEVLMFTNRGNKYTWHDPVGVTFVRGNVQPDCNLAIATGYGSVNSVCKGKATHKVYYIRGFEIWTTCKARLYRSYRRLPCIVNSEWLQRMLSGLNIRAELVYPGLDFNWFTRDNREEDRGNTMGAIFSKKHKTKNHEAAIRLAEKGGFRLLMLNRDFGGGPEELRKWYNRIKVWFSPSQLEGLHNPPMEAALCGCALVSTDSLRSGTGDYAIHGKTALVYPHKELGKALVYVRRLMSGEENASGYANDLVCLLRKKIGDRVTNMKHFLNVASRRCW